MRQKVIDRPISITDHPRFGFMTSDNPKELEKEGKALTLEEVRMIEANAADLATLYYRNRIKTLRDYILVLYKRYGIEP